MSDAQGPQSQDEQANTDAEASDADVTEESTGTQDEQESIAAQFSNKVKEFANTDDKEESNDVSTFDKFASKLKSLETEVQSQDSAGQSDNLARDFNTGNLVKEFDETNEQETEATQSNNDVAESTDDEDEDEEDEDEEDEDEDEDEEDNKEDTTDKEDKDE